MKGFLRREWLSLLLWGGSACVFWYSLSVDRSALNEAIGLIICGLVYETIHRIFGTHSEDRASAIRFGGF
jgi:hypothetical protein